MFIGKKISPDSMYFEVLVYPFCQTDYFYAYKSACTSAKEYFSCVGFHI